jgi:hypothetical protein
MLLVMLKYAEPIIDKGEEQEALIIQLPKRAKGYFGKYSNASKGVVKPKCN